MEAVREPNPEPGEARRHLQALREALRHLHKTLLESERISYEATLGPISSPYQFLHLVTSDPWFAWLSPVTRLLAAMDRMLEAQEPPTPAGVAALARQADALLVATAEGEGFSRHYDEALQRSPDVILAHAAAARLFRPKK